MYGLYNTHNQTFLTHPQVGLWYTEDRQEAESMLAACQDYLRSYQLDFLVECIVVKEIQS